MAFCGCRTNRFLRQRQCLFFFFGILLGITFGCTVTLTFGGWKTTYYYYYGGVTVAMDQDLSKEFQPLQIIEASDFSRQYSKRSEVETVYVKDRLIEEEEQSQQDPRKAPKWYDSKMFASRKSFKYDIKKLQQKQDVLISIVLRRCDHVNKINLFLDTWAGPIDIIIFVHPECIIPHGVSRDFVVQLPELGMKIYPPQKRTFAMLKYLHDNYAHVYNWFLVVENATYVHTKQLRKFVQQLNSEELHYIGYQKYLSQVNIVKYQLFPHEKYCKIGPGILMSYGLLHSLVPQIKSCLADYMNNYSNVIQEDLELGRCISRKVGIQCTNGSYDKNQDVFFEDSTDITTNSNTLWGRNFFHKLITIYPVRTESHMYALHYFYKVLEYNETKQMVVSLGKTVNRLCQDLLSRSTNGEHTQHCGINYTDDLLHTDEDISSHFHPKGKYELQPWIYFDSHSLYEDESSNPQRLLTVYKYHKRELEDVLIEIVRLANLEYPSPLVFHNLLNGYLRHNGMKGNEYIVDAEFTDANNPYIIVQRRFSLLRPLYPSFILQPSKNTVDEVVNFVVPINKVTKRLENFLQMYERLALKPRENTHLMLIVYGDEDLNHCNTLISKYSKNYPHARFTIIHGKGDFARAKALDAGMKILEKNDLAFLCDVDMHVDTAFFGRCRRNTVKGKQVYYPEIFKWYNMDYVYKFKRRPFRPHISRDTGHWGSYSYGMLCMYKSDYIDVGGLDTRITGWGGEDVEFYERILHHKLKVIRAPDPGLTHQWHEKKCVYSDRKRYEQCLMSKAEVLAERRELARYVFEIEAKKSSEHFFCL